MTARASIGALLWFLATPCRAFVLPATKVVDLWLGSTPRAENLRMEGEVTFYAPYVPGGRFEGPIRLLAERPDRIRVDLPSPQGTRSVVARGDRIEVLQPSAAVPLPPGWLEVLLREFLLPDSSAAFRDFLRSLGVDLNRTGYGRFVDRVVFILGAKEWQGELPQVWMEKDNFLPLRLSYQDRVLGKAVEAQFLEYHLKMGGWFAELIKLSVGLQPVAEIRARSVAYDTEIPEAEFSPPPRRRRP